MENIKIIKLENGDDIVCSFPNEQLPESHALLRITKPLQIKYIPQLTPQGFRDYLKGNILKYLWRYEQKHGLEDLEKAQWYLTRLTLNLEEEKNG